MKITVGTMVAADAQASCIGVVTDIELDKEDSRQYIYTVKWIGWSGMLYENDPKFYHWEVSTLARFFNKKVNNVVD